MKRTISVLVLAVAALALLVGAALKSRSVPLNAHIAQFTLTSDINRLADDFQTLVTALSTAWQSSQSPGDAAGALHQRVVGSLLSFGRDIADIPGSGAQRERMENSFERLRGPMATVDELTKSLLLEQKRYADNLALLRELGPEVVRILRANSQPVLAAGVFQLMAETIEYAAPGESRRLADARRLLSPIERERRNNIALPPELDTLLNAATAILDAKDGIESRLEQLADSPVVDYAYTLGAAASAAYDSAVSSAEKARTMLSIYAVVMLLSVGAIAYRLRGSYQQINRANADLSTLNESLEHRVEERTEDLSNALAELKESQVQLVQAEKMSSLGQLVAGISHEINTPLLYLANNASMIEERIAPLTEFVRHSASTLSLNPNEFESRTDYQARLINGLRTLKILLREHELEASIEEIGDLNRDSIEGLGDLTQMAQSLKDFSRLDRAPIDSFDVNAGLEKTLTIARNIVKHKADVRKAYGELPPIQCSPSKINQVFLNLITNAAQAIENQGEIVITTELRDPDHVSIAIADNGCGIPEENLARIRDPFFTTKEVGAGTGLGLSIVDEIIRSHGGDLLIESEVGVGSTFTVVLPVRHSGQGSPPDSAEFADDHEFAEAV
jgi:two-component system NtrC family sensor kinase